MHIQNNYIQILKFFIAAHVWAKSIQLAMLMMSDLHLHRQLYTRPTRYKG